MPTQSDLTVRSLGPAIFDSPLIAKGRTFPDPRVHVRYQAREGSDDLEGTDLVFEKAGARARLFFDPAETTAAYVTCGGLAPGLNNAIRSGYLELTHNYGVRRVMGIQQGYRGLDPAEGLEPIPLTADMVDDINDMGGTILGTSRGGRDPIGIVDYLEAHDIDILFCIGGDGTQRGAHAIAEEIARRGGARSIVGLPKTIDNDVPFVYQSFGYATALDEATEILRRAHVEAKGSQNGIGLVKVMGRDAGFIAAGAAIASQESNFCLVPEVPFPLEGEDGLLMALERRILARHHAVVVVAEGAGQELFDERFDGTDASGNPRYRDIGVLLRDRIKEHFRARELEVHVKYFDPSYAIRSVPPNAFDRILTDRMARNGVHAAMAGKTDVLMGSWNQASIWVPIATAVAETRRMNPDGDLWNAVLSTTGQPDWRASESGGKPVSVGRTPRRRTGGALALGPKPGVSSVSYPLVPDIWSQRAPALWPMM
jgi:6-phosphofructokinase 1